MKIYISINLKKRVSRIGIILLFLFIFSSCKSQDSIAQLARALVAKQRIDSNGLNQRFSKIGKPAIPYLIGVIDKKEMGFVGYQDPRSSVYYGLDNNYCGIRSAYMIEHILANTNKQWIYKFSVIVKKLDNKPLMEVLGYDDMKKIKKLYQEWWGLNRLKSLSELQNDWKNKKGPLAGSDYVWQ